MLLFVSDSFQLKEGVSSWISLRKGNASTFVLSLVLQPGNDGLTVEVNTPAFLLQDLGPFQWLSYEEWKADKSPEEAHRNDAHRDYILQQALNQGVLSVSCELVLEETSAGRRYFQACLGTGMGQKVVQGKISESVARRFFEFEMVPAK
ncbi:MAG: hypothetical protein KBD65_01275 [Candidatus Moranbacteria bacterium]|nr:hypothetical protein [Candidatus Moranbacteria bacterium]